MDHYSARLKPFIDKLDFRFVNLFDFEHNSSQKIVIFSPFAKNLERKVSLETWVDILSVIPRTHRIIGIGSNNRVEFELIESLAKKIPNLENLCSRLSFNEVLSYMLKADFYVGVDNGLSNLAFLIVRSGFVLFTNVLPQTRFPQFISSNKWSLNYGGSGCNLAPCQSTIQKSSCLKKADSERYKCTRFEQEIVDKFQTFLSSRGIN